MKRKNMDDSGEQRPVGGTDDPASPLLLPSLPLFCSQLCSQLCSLSLSQCVGTCSD